MTYAVRGSSIRQVADSHGLLVDELLGRQIVEDNPWRYQGFKLRAISGLCGQTNQLITVVRQPGPNEHGVVSQARNFEKLYLGEEEGYGYSYTSQPRPVDMRTLAQLANYVELYIDIYHVERHSLERMALTALRASLEQPHAEQRCA